MDQRGDGPKRHLLYFFSTTKLSKGEPKKLGCGEVVSANLFAAPRCFFSPLDNVVVLKKYNNIL